MATLDLHGHLTAAMVKSADVLVGYKTYPHVDGAARARSHCRFRLRLILLVVHFVPDSLRDLVPLFLNRRCDRTLGAARMVEALGLAERMVAGEIRPVMARDAITRGDQGERRPPWRSRFHRVPTHIGLYGI